MHLTPQYNMYAGIRISTTVRKKKPHRVVKAASSEFLNCTNILYHCHIIITCMKMKFSMYVK